MSFELPPLLKQETARNGETVFTVDGRSLVSSFDPSKEAQAWALKALAQIADRTSAIIIGAACGYHIKALKNLRSDLAVLTIEASENIAAGVLDIHHDINASDIIVAMTPMELTNSLKFRDFIIGRFAILTHPAQALMRDAWTSELTQFLTGRDSLAFLMQLRMRPELYALFDEEKIAALAGQQSPISILTIRNLFKAEAKASRERRIWRVLEELVV